MGLEPTLPPCKGGVLPLNYGPVKIMVGAAGIEPAATCSQSRCAAAALRSDAVTLPCLALLYLAEPFRATHWRALLHFALPSKISKAVIPMTTAPATMAALLFGFRTNQTIAAPVPATTRGRAWSLPVRGWSFSLHPRRPSLRGGVKSETVVELFCRKSPGGVSHLPQRPQRSSPCLIRPPSRCAACLRSFPPSGYPPL